MTGSRPLGGSEAFSTRKHKSNVETITQRERVRKEREGKSVCVREDEIERG